MTKKTAIELEVGEAAFVWRVDGSTELSIPKIDDDASIAQDSPTFQAFCVALLYSDTAEMSEMRRQLGEYVQRIYESEGFVGGVDDS